MGGSDKTEFVICDHTIDITYIRLRSGWLFLVVVLDWYLGKNTPQRQDFIIDNLRMEVDLADEILN